MMCTVHHQQKIIYRTVQSLSKDLKNLTLMYFLYSDSTETDEITTPTMSLLLFSG